MARWSAWLGPGTDGEVSGTRIKGGVMYRSPLSTTKHAVKLCLLTSAPSKSDNLEEREAELSKIAAACHYFNYGHLSLKKMIYVENVIFWQNGQTKHQLRCCLSALDSILTKNIKSLSEAHFHQLTLIQSFNLDFVPPCWNNQKQG